MRKDELFFPQRDSLPPSPLHLATMAGILLTCGYVALFLYLIGRWRFFDAPGLSRRSIGALFLLKVAAGTVLWWIYTHYYTDRSTADIFKFFDDGNVMFSALPAHPLDYLQMLTGIGNDGPRFDERYYSVMNHWYRQYDTGYYNDAHTMIRYSAVVRLFSFGVYHVHTVFSAFLSLIGVMALYKAFSSFVPGMGGALMAGLFLWPSVLFWGSAPIKEALLFLGLGLFLLQVFRRINGPLPWSGWLVMFLGLLIQLGLKSYVLACMVPGLAALWWCRRTGDRHALLKFGAVHLFAAVAVLAIPLVSPSFDVFSILYQKQRDMLGLVAVMEPGSYIPTSLMEPSLFGLIKEIPHALFLTFISPLVTWNVGALGLMGALENLFLLGLIPIAIFFAKPWSRIDLPMLLYCVAFCLILGLLIGWTTPVVGALMRYRVPMLPFFSLALLLIVDPHKLARWPLFRTS